MRRCWSSGGRSNSKLARLLQLVRGESEPAGPDRVLKEPLREAEKRQEFRQQPVALGREHIDVAGHHRVELRHRHLALIRPAFAEQHLARPAAPRERRAVRHIAPRPDVQRAWFKMLHRDDALQSRRRRIARLVEILDHVIKPHPRPVLAIEQRQLGPIRIGLELG